MHIEPVIQDRRAQPYLGIRREVTEGVPAAVDGAFPQLFGWLGERGIEPAGPPFIRVRETDENGEPRALEAAVPTSGRSSGEGDIVADALPAGRYVAALHVGPYRSETETDLGDAREQLLAWVAERGGAVIEGADHLLVGPESGPDFTKWTTELTYLISEEDSPR